MLDEQAWPARMPVHRPLPVQPSAGDPSGGKTFAPTSTEGDGEQLSTAEAVAAFEVSQSTLRRLLAAGTLDAQKVSGARGRGWRIPASALERAGYARRESGGDEPASHAEVRRLQQSLQDADARAAQLDGRLGYALLTIGRLRGRLRAAGIDPDELFGADLAACRCGIAASPLQPDGKLAVP